MGDIKISDIKKQFRAIAENANKVENGGNGDKFLNGNEISVFIEHARFAGATDKDFEKMGLAVEKQEAATEEVKEETAAVTNPQTTTKPSTLTKAEQNNVDKRVKQAIKELVKKGATKEGFIASLENKFAKVSDGKVVTDEAGKPIIQEEFAQAIADIKAVAEKIDIDKVTTKKEAKSVKKEAEKEFPKATEAQKAFIDKLQDWAEASAVSKRLETLRAAYNEKLGTGHNFKIALDALEKDLKTKKDGKKDWNTDYTDDAFKLLTKDAKQMALSYERATLHTSSADVIAETERVLEQEKNGEVTKEEADKIHEQLDKDMQVALSIEKAEKKKGVRKALKAANTENDKFLKAAYKKRLSGKYSKTVKHDMKEVARDNKSNHKIEATLVEVTNPETGETTKVSQMSAEAMKKDLKKRVNGNTKWHGIRQYTLISSFGNMSSKDAEKLISKLRGNTNYYDPETNTFNLQAIKDDVVTDIGNMVLDAEDDKHSSEIENLKAHMNARMGLTGKDKINTSEARALVKLVEADIEHPDLVKAGAVGAVTTLASGLAGLIGGLTARHGRLEVTQMVQLKVSNADVFNDLTSQLQDMGIQFSTTDLSAGKKGITILQQVIKGDKQFTNALFGAINGLAIGAAAGILTALIVGEEASEDTCMPVGDYDVHNTRYTDPEQYKQYISNRYSANQLKVSAIKAMVDKYVEFYGKDNWHVEFQNDIRLAAGLGSKMNPEECLKFFSQKKYVKPQQTNSNNNTINNNNNNNNNTQDAVRLVPHCSQNSTTSTPVSVPRLSRQEDWGVMAEKYDCLKKNHPEIFGSHRVKTRYMKAIQAITDNNYKLSNIKTFVDVSLGVKLKGKGHEREDMQNLRMAFQKAIAEGKVNPDTFSIETFIKLIVYPQVQPQKVPTIIDDTNGNVTCEYNQKKKIPYTRQGSWGKGTPTAPENDVSLTHSSIPGNVDVVDKDNKVIHTASTVKDANKWAEDNKLKVSNPDVKDC